MLKQAATTLQQRVCATTSAAFQDTFKKRRILAVQALDQQVPGLGSRIPSVNFAAVHRDWYSAQYG